MSTEEREEKVEVSEFAQLKQQVFLLTQSLQAKLSRQDFDLVSVTQDLASVKHQLSILQSQQELDSVLEDSGDSSTSEAEIIQLRTDVDKLLELLRLENSYELTGESGQVVVEWVGPNRKEVRLIDKTIHRFQPKTHGKYPGKIFFSEGTWFWPAPNPSSEGDPFIIKSATLVVDETENVVTLDEEGTFYVKVVLDVEEEALSLEVESTEPDAVNERTLVKVVVEGGSGDDAGSFFLGPMQRAQLGDIWDTSLGQLHDRKHRLNSVDDHEDIGSGLWEEDNLMSFDSNGLPKDSGYDPSDFASYEDLHDEYHTIESHTDTSATGAELDQLTDGSNADGLHEHSQLVAGPVIHSAVDGQTAFDHSQAPHAPVEAEQNVQSDWDEDDDGHDAHILNKPDLGQLHDKKHRLNSVDDHEDIGSWDEDNLMSFDSNGLPKDSGYDPSDFASDDHEHPEIPGVSVEGGSAINVSEVGSVATVNHDFSADNHEDFFGALEGLTIDEFGHIVGIETESGGGGPGGPPEPEEDVCDQNDHPIEDDPNESGSGDDESPPHPDGDDDDDDDDTNGSGSGDTSPDHPSDPDCYSTIPDPLQ